MLEEFEVSSRREKGLLPFALLITAKILRSFSLFKGWSLLHHYDYPIFLYTYYVFLCSSVLLLIVQRPWTSRKPITTNQWIRIGTYAVILISMSFLWNAGLKYYGPLRSILLTDYGDLIYPLIFTTFLRFNSATESKIKGASMAAIAYLVLMLFDGPDTDSYYGCFALILALILNVIRKDFSQKLHTEMGAPKRTFALAITSATVVMTPFALISEWNNTVHEEIYFFSTLVTFFLIAIFVILGEFYSETMASASMDIATLFKVGISSAVLSTLFFEMFWAPSSFSLITFVAFALLFFGAHQLLNKKLSAEKDLPMYGSPLQRGATTNVFTSSFLKSSFRQIWENRESRRIFIYLCFNLMFMFVESLYGWLTNSLGLISDAAHMLFDSMALVIGLFASVIANWEPNQVYSYGYGRVEVVSGFINGIFLIFIAFAVLLESMERFFHPQEINTDKLLLVSCLGLVVNLIGVFAFHDLHGGGGDHAGHSHSHGHSHGHGHGHEHGEKKAKNSNLYGVYLHIIADTLGSVGVITSSLLIQYFGWTTADPVCSFCISLLIFVSVIPLLTSSSTTLLQCTPPDFDKKLKKILNEVVGLEGVVSYRNLHIWQHYKDLMVGTINVQITPEAAQQKILAQVTKIFKKKGVKSLTVEISR